MKIKFATITVIILFALGFNVSYGQSDVKYGVGVGVSPLSLLGLNESFHKESMTAPYTLYFPITMSSIRIEPELSIFSATLKEELRTNNSISTQTFRETFIRTGVGLFAHNTARSTTLYYGIRTGLIFQTVSSQNARGEKRVDSETDFYVGPAIGGEFNFSPRFSFGGEAQIIASFTKFEEDNFTENLTVIQSRPVLFVRVYL